MDSATRTALRKENAARDAGLLEMANRTRTHADVSEDLLQAISDWALQARSVRHGADQRESEEPLQNGARVETRRENGHPEGGRGATHAIGRPSDAPGRKDGWRSQPAGWQNRECWDCGENGHGQWDCPHPRRSVQRENIAGTRGVYSGGKAG